MHKHLAASLFKIAYASRGYGRQPHYAPQYAAARPAYAHQEGSYRGSDQTAVPRYMQQVQAYQAGFGGQAPDGQQQQATAQMNNVYNQANSLDQAKIVAASLRRAQRVTDQNRMPAPQFRRPQAAPPRYPGVVHAPSSAPHFARRM